MRRWVVRTLLAAALAWAGYQVAGQLGAALHALLSADAGRLVVAAAFEVVSYLLIGTVVRRLVRDRRVSRGDAIRIGFVAVGLGNLLPAAPVEGMVMAARELEGRGVARRRTYVIVALAQWYCARALFAVAALTALGVATFAALYASPFAQSWPWLLVGGALLAGLFFVMGAIVRRVGLGDAVSRWCARVPLGRARMERVASEYAAWSTELRVAIGSRRDRVLLIALALGAILAEASCFVFALRAAGVNANPGLLLLAYALGMLGMFVPLMPAGLGVVETAVPALLHHAGVPIAVALAGVLAYRALATLMPAFVGAGALGHLRLRRRRGAMAVPAGDR
jgi:uncharacterized protein (TIRG00374 family)